MRAALLFLVALLCGCTSTRIEHSDPTYMMVGTNLVRSGGGFVIDRTTGLTKHSVADLQVTTTTNGISFGMRGYMGDNVQALGIAVESAVKAGVAAATGKP